MNAIVVKGSAGMEYACVAVLLRNLGEMKDTTSLEREALSACYSPSQARYGG